MKALRRNVAAALFVLTAPAALAETKAWQDTLTLPTCLEGPPETVPRIEAIDPSQSLFPYITYPYSVRLLRRAGKADEARQRLEEARAIDPVDSFLQLEGIQLGADDDVLWLHLAADPERVLEIGGVYFDFGMYRDAMDYPLVAYCRGHCRQELNQSGDADFKVASSQRLEYVFPNRSSSVAPLEAAIEEEPRDGPTHFLLGLLYLNDNWTANAVAELHATRAIRKDIPELYYVLGGALLASKEGTGAALSVLREGMAAAPSKELKDLLALAAPAAAPAPKPSPQAATVSAAPQKPGTPTEIAEDALALAADGKLVAAVALFTAENFPQDKQPDSIQKAYIEVQLQFLRNHADRLDCADALRGVASIGAGDAAVPFTRNGFGAWMNGARFQYYLGAVENLCGKSKAARRRWSQVARMKPAIFSADFSFPVVAAQSLAPKGKGPNIQPSIDEVSKALESAGDDAKGTLLYSKGVLLLALGQEAPGLARFEEGLAIGAFEEGAHAPDFGMSRYWNNLVLREARKADPR